MALLLASCGSGVSSNVSVSITPTQATVAAGSTVMFRGDATGHAPLTPDWWVQESYDVDIYKDCGFLRANDASFTNCPFGFVVISSDYPHIPSHATYFTPLTPGTYHVSFHASWSSGFDIGGKTASATVTVTP
jgi:hypothetical protein